MKQTKRMVSVLLSLAMLLGLGITPVSAMEVRSEGLSAVFENPYAKEGEPLVIVPAGGVDYTYEWSVGGKVIPGSNEDRYTPRAADLEKMIKVTVSSGGQTVEQSMYFSKLPVVYIETDGHAAIPSSKEYIPGSMHIQGSETLNEGLYDGKLTIKLRGNSTSGLPKAPYKIKLDKKTAVLGMEKSKHWVLLANYLDPSLMRNTIAYDLAGEMGQTHTETKWVDVILNGNYVGNYQLCEHVRVSKGVVDIFEWEDAASQAAEDIADAAGMSKDDASDLETLMTEHMDWIETKKVTFKGQEYAVTTQLPSITGGFLMELSAEYDEVSKFRTKANLPIMFNKPEFAGTSPALFNYTKGYVQAFEDSVSAQDFYTMYQGRPTHYSELFDFDSLVDYWLIEEFFSNVDFMRKSTYFYKDIDGLAKMGPVWDFDWSSGGQNDTGPAPTNQWRTLLTVDSHGPTAAWYDKLIKDPYFIIKAQERYLEIRPTLLEDIVKSGGTIEQAQAYLKESGTANSAKWPGNFMNDSNHFKDWLTQRLTWLDAQYPTESTLMSSLGYQPDSSLKLSASDSQGEPLPADTLSTQAKAFAVVEDESDVVLSLHTGSDTVKKAAVYVNGLLHGKVDVTGRKAETTISGSELTAAPGEKDIVQVRGLDTAGKETGSNYISLLETEAVRQIPIEGEVAILGDAAAGETLRADLTKLTPEGAQVDCAWTREGVETPVGTESTYTVGADDIGKTITLTVSGAGSYTGTLTAEVYVAPGGAYSVAISADRPSVQVGGDVAVTVTARGGTFVGAACKLSFESEKFEVKSVPDGWELLGDNSYSYYNVINNGFYEENKVLGTFIFTVSDQPGETAGRFTLTNNYIVAGWEEGLSKEDAVKLSDRGVAVAVIPAPAYVVETVNDYVSGHSLVLVYTNDKAAAYNYGSTAMFDVTSAGYRYRDTTEYAHVYGLVVKGTADPDQVAEGAASAGTLIYSNDVNGSGSTDLKDAVAVAAVYNANELYMNSIHMNIVLKADVNRDKKVNVDDFGLIKAEYRIPKE